MDQNNIEEEATGEKAKTDARKALRQLPSIDEKSSETEATTLLQRDDASKDEVAEEATTVLSPEAPQAKESLGFWGGTGRTANQNPYMLADDEAPEFDETTPDEDEPHGLVPLSPSFAEGRVVPEEAPLPLQTNTSTPFLASVIPPDTQAKRRGRAKLVVALACAVLLVLGGVYVYFANYYTTHFFPHTTVNGDDVSGMSVEELSNYVTQIGSSYKTHVSGLGIDLTINGSDISFVYDGAAYGNDAGSQIAAWRWPIELGRPHAYIVSKGITFDEGKVNEIVSGAVDKLNETATQPTNATMAYDNDKGEFMVVPDAVGTAIQKEAVMPVVVTGVSTMQDEIALTDDMLVQPTVTRDNETLTSTVKRANDVIDKPISLQVGGNEVHNMNGGQMVGWIGIDDQLNMTVNHDAIVSWAQGPLSLKLDSKGTKRAYTRPDGKQIEVEGGDPDYNYGWCVDGMALGDIIFDRINNGSHDAIDVPMKSTGASWNPGGQDWSARYIDVDLSEQHVRMYDEASQVIWETDCVSGNPSYGGGTDTGVFTIYMKASPMTLVGLDYNGDGEPDYRTDVTFWMPFDGGEGLHDAGWRGAFGGNIFSYDGSHGCVNLPYDKAQELYNITNVGDVVVVHW